MPQYTVQIRDHIMIAHSLPDPFFGPAQNMHGATYVVDVYFISEKLNPQNVVIDMGQAHSITKEVLTPLGYQNLDLIPKFIGNLTTTEFLAKHIHDSVKSKILPFFKGKLKINLGESHIAWASYEGDWF